MTGSETKACTKCGEVKPLKEFSPHAECKGGYRPDCKLCVAARVKALRDADPDLHRQRDRERYAASSERQDRMKATARKHYADNRQAHLEQRKAYYETHPEVFERARQKRKAFERGVEHQPYSRREIYDRDGGACKGCGTALDYKPRGFEIDHIVPISLGGADTPANVQLMCQPCNRRKWATLEGQLYFAT